MNLPRLPGRPRWWAVGVLAVVTLLIFVAYFTPLLGVRSVRVEGNERLANEEVLEAAQVHTGKSMLRLDSEEIRSRLEGIPKVVSADVRLSWPSTITLDVTERTPMAFTLSGKGIELLDGGGTSFDVVQEPPSKLPELRVRNVSAQDPATKSAMVAVRAIPPDLRARTKSVTATGPRDVRLRLKDGRTVEWGGPKQAARKAAIVPILLRQPGKVYDVTSPDLPTVAS